MRVLTRRLSRAIQVLTSGLIRVSTARAGTWARRSRGGGGSGMRGGSTWVTRPDKPEYAVDHGRKGGGFVRGRLGSPALQRDGAGKHVHRKPGRLGSLRRCVPP